MVDRCAVCHLDLRRHTWLIAMWITTWATVIGVVGWVVFGLVVTGAHGAWWVDFGAVGLAILVPPAAYPYAKSVQARLLLRLDPPTERPR